MVARNWRGGLALCIFCCQTLLLVTTLPASAEELLTDKPATEESSAVSVGEANGTIGVATYYAKRYNGKRTMSGRRYDPAKLTAAHPTIPLGTSVKVVNLANGREVVVKVNDRCRKRQGEIVDLSRAAARQLGFLGKGLARVRIIPLESEDS